MAQESTLDKGLQRFRAALAEVEKEVDICPDCDSLLAPAFDTSGPKGVPGEVATLLPYRYCERCKNYFLHGKASLASE